MTRARRLCDTFGAYPFLPGWRNWQTQRTQNPPTLAVMGVRPPLPAPQNKRFRQKLPLRILSMADDAARRAARERQSILVVHCRVVNSDRDIARYEVIFFQLDQVRRNVFTISVREECFEGHGFVRTLLLTEFRDVLLERPPLVEPVKAGLLEPIVPTCQAALLPQ